MLSAAVGSGVIYSYLGFQGPLDFAGNVRSGGIGEAARLRRAVFGTVLGSILLYAALQCVIIYLRYDHHSTGNVDYSQSVYATFAGAVVGHGWLGRIVTGLINLDSVLSPAGTAMVFTFVMTREVAALSRAHLTHRGLQRSKNSVIRLPEGLRRKLVGDDRLDLYWRILGIDFVISLVSLLVTSGHWSVLQNIPTIMALLVYATPSIVLVSLRERERKRFPKRWYVLMAKASFATLAVTFVLYATDVLWGMGALAVGCGLLFGLPAVLPSAPRYDAQAHWRAFGDLRKNTAARLGAVLGGYFAVLTIAEVIRRTWLARVGAAWDIAGLAVVVLISLIAFRWLVGLSASYMGEDPDNPPLLPEPLPAPARRHAATGTGS
jgi:amino acid transporter